MSGSDVVVTGIGAVSAAGVGVAALSEALRNDRACAGPAHTDFSIAQLAAVPDHVSPHPFFPDDRKAWLGLAALSEACTDAGLSAAVPACPRRAVFLGTGLSSITPGELEEDVYTHLDVDHFDTRRMARDLASDRASPRRHLPARLTDYVVAELGAGGSQGTSFSACAAAAQAIAEGMWAIRRGDADVAIVGGHDSMLHPMGLLSFVALGALSPGISRPFDRRRDGFLLGEGAGVLILERASFAKARGARIHARLLGAGTSADAWNVTAPHPEGLGAELAMRRALRDAGLEPSHVGYINAHGTGTPLGDIAESRGISRVFGGEVPVSSIKGAIGHTIAAAGALEAIACVLSLQGGWLPGTVGLSEVDVRCPVSVLSNSKPMNPEVVLSNSFGFGGQNCSLIFGRG